MDQLGEFSQIFRVLGFLGVFACIAYFLNKFISKKYLSHSSINGTNSGIVLCDTRSLGNKQFLVVAQYDKEKFLLGVSSGKIEMLSKLNTNLEVSASSIPPSDPR